MTDHNGWNEHQLMVLNELKRHSETLDQMNEKMTDIKVELSAIPPTVQRLVTVEKQVVENTVALAALKVQAGLWGTFGGLLGAVAFLLLQLARK